MKQKNKQKKETKNKFFKTCGHPFKMHIITCLAIKLCEKCPNTEC